MNISIQGIAVMTAAIGGFLCITGNVRLQRSQNSIADTTWVYTPGEAIISASSFEEPSLLVS